MIANRSLFQASPFRPAYGIQPIAMGQLEDLTGDVESLLQPLDDLITKLPVEAVGPYKTRRDECMAKPIWSQYKCLYDLFQDVKDKLKGEGDAPVAPPKPPPAAPQASTGIPIWAIAIGGVAAAGILYAAFGK